MDFSNFLQHWFLFAVYAALIHSMPPPNGNKWYNFLYRFLHALAANIDRMRQPSAPSVKEGTDDGGK